MRGYFVYVTKRSVPASRRRPWRAGRSAAAAWPCGSRARRRPSSAWPRAAAWRRRSRPSPHLGARREHVGVEARRGLAAAGDERLRHRGQVGVVEALDLARLELAHVGDRVADELQAVELQLHHRRAARRLQQQVGDVVRAAVVAAADVVVAGVDHARGGHVAEVAAQALRGSRRRPWERERGRSSPARPRTASRPREAVSSLLASTQKTKPQMAAVNMVEAIKIRRKRGRSMVGEPAGTPRAAPYGSPPKCVATNRLTPPEWFRSPP